MSKKGYKEVKSRSNRGEIEGKMGYVNLLSGPNSNHRLEPTVYRPSAFVSGKIAGAKSLKKYEK